jgi:hypothetical protein
MRYCVDCRHYSKISRYEKLIHVCQSPKLGNDMVTGESNRMFCIYLRGPTERCGPDATWFEAKDHQPVDRVCRSCGKKHTGAFNLCTACGVLP